MPTNVEIATARARGADADKALEEFRLGLPQPPNLPPPQLAPQATAGIGCLWCHWPSCGHPAIDSRIGQHAATRAADGPPQRITTN
jgi:hypothetical protein